MNLFDKFFRSLCIVAIIILSGCSQKEQKTETVFSETVKPLAGTVLIGEEYLQDPCTITVLDSLLIVGNSKGTPLIEVYNRFSQKLIGSFLEKGQGPIEITFLSQFQTSDGRLFITDLFSRKMLSVDKSNIGKDSVVVEAFFSLTGFDEKIIEVVVTNAYLNDKYNVVSTSDNRGRLGLINREKKTLSFFYPFTESEVLFPELDSNTHNRLFSFEGTVHPQNNRIALATYMADILDIYEYKNDKFVPVWHYQTFLPNGIKILTFEGVHPQAFFTKKTVVGYHGITSSSKNVYALFVGIAEEDGDYYYTNRIRVFDWNGKNRFEIKTDYPIKRIAVDPEDHFIYGISHDEDGAFIIVRFDLRELK
jgi:hypothetical protein